MLMCKNDIKVTVFCPTYNHERYIYDALESFVSQEVEFRYEVIVRDDASTDKTADIIQQFADQYPDIIKPILMKVNTYMKSGYILTEDLLSMFRGEYFIVTEGDDQWTDNHKLQKQVDFLDSNPEYSLCASGLVFKNMETGEELDVCEKRSHRFDLSDYINEKISIHTSTVLLRGSIGYKYYKKCLDENYQTSDLSMYAMCLLEGSGWVMNDKMSLYRWHSGPWSHTSMHSRSEQMRFTLESYSVFDKLSDYKYHRMLEKPIRRAIYEINGYTLIDLFFDWYLLKPFLRYRLVDKLAIICKIAFPKLYTKLKKKYKG